MLSILKEYNIKATFFVVGNSVLGNEEILKHVHEQGHSIGVHSRTHDYKQVYSSVEAFLKEYDYTNQLIKNITGEDTPIFRYPGGSNNRVSNCDIMKQIKEEMQGRGFAHFDWNCSAQDATIPLKTVDEIYNSVVLQRQFAAGFGCADSRQPKPYQFCKGLACHY